MTTISESVSPWRPGVELAVVPSSGPTVDNGEATEGFELFGDDGFTFLDFIDVINPLQHIPIVGTLYRELTGDDIDPGSRVLGGTLFLGPVGTVASIANVLIDDATGKDMGEHVLAFFDGEEEAFPEVSDNGNRPVALNPASAPLTAPMDIGATQVAALEQKAALDPVTAWAIAETSYRNSRVGKAPAAQSTTTGPAPAPDQAQPYREQANAPARESVRGIDALAALRADLKAGGVAKKATNTIRGIQQDSASLTAAAYERRQPANTTRTPPPGAIAAKGGWFTGTMLTALGRYQAGADLSGNGQAAGVDIRR